MESGETISDRAGVVTPSPHAHAFVARSFSEPEMQVHTDEHKVIVSGTCVDVSASDALEP